MGKQQVQRAWDGTELGELGGTVKKLAWLQCHEPGETGGGCVGEVARPRRALEAMIWSLDFILRAVGCH